MLKAKGEDTMKRKLMIIAAVCIVAGAAMAGIGWSMGGTGFNITKDGMQLIADMTEYTYTDMDMEEFSAVTIDVYDCPVYIHRANDGKYGVDVSMYLPKSDKDKVELKVEKGELILKASRSPFNLNLSWNFDFTGDREGHIDIYLPEKEYNDIYVCTSNARIEVEDLDVGDNKLTADTSNGNISLLNVNSGRLLADTSNAKVTIENSFFDEVVVDTSNGVVQLDKVEAESFDVKSSNASIIFDKVYGNTAKLDTSNGKVILTTIHFAKKLEVETSNAAIELLLDGQREDYTLSADTSNSSIYVDGDKTDDDFSGGKGDAKVKLDTSNGKITVEFAQ